MDGVRTNVTRLGRAWHRRVAGIHVMKLAGSHYEMGRQHGALLRDHIPHGPVPYYRGYVERVLRRMNLAPATPVVYGLLKQTVGRRVAAAIPDFAREALRGLSEGSGIPLDELVEGCTMPDTFLWVTSRIVSLTRSERAVAHRVALELGCSSAVAWGEATLDGRLLHARNFDYQGVEPWPREAAVIFHEPDRGHRYVSVSSAGVLLGGATAMNEAGLTLTVHQHMFTSETRLGGTPIGIVGDIVMREASSLDEAQAILARYRPIGCWTYLIADGKNREVLCWEENPTLRAAIRTAPGDSTFRYANIYLDRALGQTERNLYGSYWRANQGRYQRLGERLAAEHGRIDARAMAGILADTGGDACRLRRPIAMLMTVASVIFRPEDGVFWVATGKAPTSHNRFEPFSLRTEDHAPEHGALSVGAPEGAPARAAFDAYRDAYLAYFDRHDLPAARALLATARALQPEEALYHFVYGLLSIALGAASDAEAAFDRAIALGHPDPERVAGFHLWRARARDLRGDRAGAIADYEAVLSADRCDPPVARAARRGLRTAFTARRGRRVAIEFAYGDVVAP